MPPEERHRTRRIAQVAALSSFVCLLADALPVAAQVGSAPIHLQVTVNSSADGPIKADEALTLREAIALVNGTLSIDRLTALEKAQVNVFKAEDASQIAFALSPTQATIRLTSELPAIVTPGVTIDGTTQPGYDKTRSATAEIDIPVPVVEITPAENIEVSRGLTISADRVTIRGLSLHGFTAKRMITASTPPADIFIAHRFAPPDLRKQPTPANFSPFYANDLSPQDVVIENNWLGIRPAAIGQSVIPPVPSAFGVSVFNGINTIVRRNRIESHEGSGILTSVNAQKLQVTENIIVGNGLAGMSDAIRLEGNIDQSKITGNWMCGNDGAGVFLFKPQGSTTIRQNTISYNGRRLRRSAVFLMGSGHEVSQNQIVHQAGSGVVVAADPKSDRNRIQENRITAIEGLSIDLNTYRNVGVEDFQRGDGRNPQRNSENRRKETGNAAINAPEFISREFILSRDRSVDVMGKADPGSEIEISQALPTTKSESAGPLSRVLTQVATDATGRFQATLTTVKPGDRITATATDPRYGTSEPAINAVIRAMNEPPKPLPTPVSTSVPRCTTPPIAIAPPAPNPTVQPPLKIKVPTHIHFALGNDTIGAASAALLNQIVTVMQAYPNLTADIEGHTDPRASDAYNLDLGARRAKAARNYLVRQGIAPERFTIRSIGEKQRLRNGSSRVDDARDRQVQFRFEESTSIELLIEATDLPIKAP